MLEMIKNIEKKKIEKFEDKVKPESVNIYYGKRIKGKEDRFNIYRLKTTTEKNLLEEIKNKIEETLNREKVFYNNMDIEKEKVTVFNANEILTWKNIKEEMLKNTPTPKEINDSITIIIIEFFTTGKSCYLFSKYEYNRLIKKNCFSFGTKDKFETINTKGSYIILDLNIDAMIYDGLLYALKLRSTEEIFNFTEYYDTEIAKELDDLKLILNFQDKTIKSKKDKRVLLYGIKNGHINNYKNLPREEKEKMIEEFKEAYKIKEKKDIDISLTEDSKIQLTGLNALEKTEILKLISNKSGKKFLGKTLASTIE